MLTDKHLFSELIYAGPKALAAIKNAICNRFGHEAFEDEDGHPWAGEEVITDFLITLSADEHLKIVVITQQSSSPSKEYIIGEEIFRRDGSVCSVKRVELIEKLRGSVCIYATVVKGNQAAQKGDNR